MKLPPFLLDEWLDRYKTAPIRHDLASSTGPTWTLRELLALASEDERAAILDRPLVYCAAAGEEELRAGIAALHGVSAEDVLVTTGAAEALHILFFDAAERGANVVVSAPGFPPTWALPEAMGLEVRRYRLSAERGFRLDVDEVARLVDAQHPPGARDLAPQPHGRPRGGSGDAGPRDLGFIARGPAGGRRGLPSSLFGSPATERRRPARSRSGGRLLEGPLPLRLAPRLPHRPRPGAARALAARAHALHDHELDPGRGPGRARLASPGDDPRACPGAGGPEPRRLPERGGEALRPRLLGRARGRHHRLPLADLHRRQPAASPRSSRPRESSWPRGTASALPATSASASERAPRSRRRCRCSNASSFGRPRATGTCAERSLRASQARAG